MKIFELMRELNGEVPGTYNGGGKKAPPPAAVPDYNSNVNSQSSIANLLAGAPETLDETEDTKEEESISKKKMGTRGLRIPLAAEGTPTNSANSASSTGVQL